jgi:hypothetical protein
MTKNLKKFTAVKLSYIGSKIAIYLSLGHHKGRTSYRRSLQPSKENIQHFKTLKFYTFFNICGSFLPSWIRIHIQQLKLMRIHADPDPQPWIRSHKTDAHILLGTDPATQINADPDPQPWIRSRKIDAHM